MSILKKRISIFNEFVHLQIIKIIVNFFELSVELS